MTSYRNILVFTDLDGTLIDHDTYSWKAAEPAISRLKAGDIPIIPCTSKTRAEIEFYRKSMGLESPFISENGGGIFIPEDYFGFDYSFDRKADGYNIIELGRPYAEIRKAMGELSSYGKLEGFGDWAPERLAEHTGLSLQEAELAKAREYDEAFVFEGDEEGLKKAIAGMGLGWTKGGRYWHIMGNNDKGKAVKILAGLYKMRDRKLKTVGLGDSLNDLPMLQAVDMPILIRKKDGSYDERATVDRLLKTEKPGPSGWNEEILRILG
jgi:mannosyl-3-phosphoglycerate phosphatase